MSYLEPLVDGRRESAVTLEQTRRRRDWRRTGGCRLASGERSMREITSRCFHDVGRFVPEIRVVEFDGRLRRNRSSEIVSPVQESKS